MMPKAEAQRVIAISLGKIASYRNQRGGSSLHKNLLVANVLQKVRSFVVDGEEELSLFPEHCPSFTTFGEAPQEMVCDVNNLPELEDNSPAKPNSDTEPVCSLQKPEATSEFVTTTGSSKSREPVIGCDVTDIAMGDCSNDDPSNNESGVSPVRCGLTSTCDVVKSVEKSSSEVLQRAEMRLQHRCLKRRQSLTEDSDSVRVKRRKYDQQISESSANLASWRVANNLSDSESDAENDSCLHLDQEVTSSSSQRESSMDVEQICNLVSVFRCSFRGLIGSSSDQIQTTSSSSGPLVDKSQVSEQGLSNCGREGKPSLRRGLSLPDLCAKQADLLSRQSFELSTPVLALTV